MMRSPRPDDDAMLTALDGRVVDVAVSVRDETVGVVVLGADTITLTPAGARSLAARLQSGAAVFDTPASI